MEIVLILPDIRSSENVGSIFRTADAAGVSRIYLCGYTPAPLDRFKRKNTKLVKAALGAEEFVSWEEKKDALALISELKEKGFEIIALEQSPDAISYTEYIPKKNIALIVGNEVEGISPAILERADITLAIPMRGKKESLNVSVAAGIALFALNR
jgi:tRNA G18 (ribose-2'-O)-methylase SpoU